ncbi:endonuclease III [soil metagenome]
MTKNVADSEQSQRNKVQEILKRLYLLWPEPKSELLHKNAFEMLIATILSAQTTDIIVNKVTPALFAAYPTPQDLANAEPNDVEMLINKVNFHKTKAKNIIGTGKMLVEKFDGEVPNTVAEIMVLPGAARKTANVVIGNMWGKAEGIVVDTHVRRLSNALGLTTEQDPIKIEKDLMQIVPKDKWIDFSHLLILYGRYKCTARMKTAECPLLTDIFI